MLKAFHKVIDLQQMNVIIYLHDLFLYVYIITFKINDNMKYHFIFIFDHYCATCMYMYTCIPIWYAKLSIAYIYFLYMYSGVSVIRTLSMPIVVVRKSGASGFEMCLLLS